MNHFLLNVSLVKVDIKMNTGYLSAAEWPLLPVSVYEENISSVKSRTATFSCFFLSFTVLWCNVVGLSGLRCCVAHYLCLSMEGTT